MAKPEPEMRASHMQANIACLQTLGSDAQAVRRQCAHAIAPVEQALRVSWLPLRLNVELIQCVEDICGEERARKWVYASIARSMHGTLLKPIVDGLSRLGLGPQHGLRRCVQGWRLMYRHCGSLECALAKVGEAKLILHDGPELMYCDAYLRALMFGFEGIAVQLGGTLTDTEIVDSPEAQFTLRWTV